MRNNKKHSALHTVIKEIQQWQSKGGDLRVGKKKKTSEMFAFFFNHPFCFMCGDEETLGQLVDKEERKL